MSNTDFLRRLNHKVFESLFNNFGKENYDEYRYGSFQKQSFRGKFLDSLRERVISTKELKEFTEKYDRLTADYADSLDYVYQNLDQSSRELFLTIIAYRVLGYKKVKLPLNSDHYRNALEKVKDLKDANDTVDPHFMHFILEKFDLKDIGYDVKLYFSDIGIVTDYMIEQYAYKIGDEYVVEAEKGDVVLDVGGCWGDTGLYFSHKVGAAGKVFSFEFIPNNLEIYEKNLNLNPELKERIKVVQFPVSDKSDQKMYYLDNGPGSTLSDKPFEGQNGEVSTVSIDDFVERENLSKVDYIKMDIEGAEPFALRGAINTIKKFRPKLAVAIYHSLDDFVNIPKWIIDLDLDYEFYLGHYTIHSEESIFFAKPKNK